MLHISTAVAILVVWRIHGLRPHGSNTGLSVVEAQLDTEIKELLKRTEPTDVGLSRSLNSLGTEPGKGGVTGVKVDGAIDLMRQAAATLALMATTNETGEVWVNPSEGTTSTKSLFKTAFVEAGNDLKSGVKASSSIMRTVTNSIKESLGIPIGLVSSEMGFQDCQLRFIAGYSLHQGNWLIQFRTSIRFSLMDHNLEIDMGEGADDAKNVNRTPGNFKWIEYPQDVRLCHRGTYRLHRNVSVDYFCVGARPNFRYFDQYGKFMWKNVNLQAFFTVTVDEKDEEDEPVAENLDPLAPVVSKCFNKVASGGPSPEAAFFSSRPGPGHWRRFLDVQIFTMVNIGWKSNQLGPNYKWNWKREHLKNGTWTDWQHKTFLGFGGFVKPGPGDMDHWIWDLGLGRFNSEKNQWRSISPFVMLPVFNIERDRSRKEEADAQLKAAMDKLAVVARNSQKAVSA